MILGLCSVIETRAVTISMANWGKIYPDDETYND